MQIEYLHKNIYKLYSLTTPEKAKSDFHLKAETEVKAWKILSKKGISLKEKQDFVGISRATFYRRKACLENPIFFAKGPKKSGIRSARTQDNADLVLQIRKQNPTYGKLKIAAIMKSEHKVSISASSVGRILKEQKVEKSLSSPTYHKTRSRKFTGYAKRLLFKAYDAMELGECVQIDHMTVTVNGITVKQFSAWARKSKFLYSDVFLKADSKTAAKFLRELIAEAPYPIKSIQVDGGSEFMKHFDDACEEFNIPLFVVPPRTPKYNGGVERSNRTLREEFYAYTLEDSVTGLRQALRDYLKKYNSYRPHFSLNGETPLRYLQRTLGDSFPSQKP